MNEEIETINEKQDSIKINRTSKGAYSWEIKRYYDFDKMSFEQVIQQIEKIDKELANKFREEE